MEIETLELSNATARQDVKGKEASTTALVAARSTAISTLEQQAAYLETQLAEATTQSHRMMEEIKSTFSFIDVLFTSLGCDSALAPRKEPTSMQSPLSKQTASLAMYASPALIEAVKDGGVSASSLSHFMGMTENRCADIIQTYAAMVTTGALDENGGDAVNGDAEIEALKAEKNEIEIAKAVDDAVANALAEDAAGEPTEAAPVVQSAPQESARRFISSSALGPSQPTGKLKESLTTSALVAAMASTVSAGGPVVPRDGAAVGAAAGAGKGRTGRDLMHSSRHQAEEEPEDDAFSSGPLRPFSMEELKSQAHVQLNSDESYKVISNAAQAAASILGRH
jgi:hypothetical protein